MPDQRMTGLMLMGLATAAFLGSTSGALPPATFFPAFGLFSIGAFKFLRSNSAVMARAEKRARKRVNPTLRENRHVQAHAERLAARRGGALNSISGDDAAQARRASRPPPGHLMAARDAIEIDDLEKNFVVTTDVSFPVEIQTGDALADQLNKLNQLMGRGVLTEEEYAIAKAKLLG